MKHKEKNRLLAIFGTLFTITLVVLVTMQPTVAVWVKSNLGITIPWAQLQVGDDEDKTTTPGVVKGIVTSAVSAFDSLDIATARTVGTNVNIYWYAQRDGSWVLLGSGDADDINIQAADNEIIYCVMSVPSGQNYYVDYSKILSMNHQLESVQYMDIDGDNVEEYVFRQNIDDIPYASGTGKYNMPTVNAYLLTYDSSWSIPTGGQQADITNIGTTKVTKYLEWYSAFSAEKKAAGVCKVVLSINTSDISKVTLKKLNVPGVGYLDGSSFEQDVLTSSIKWTYTISNVLYQADYLKLPVNTINKQEFTTAIELDLASSDVLQASITIYYFDATESQQQLTDSVILQEAA